MRRLFSSAFAAALSIACSGGVKSPTISNLTYSPQTSTANVETVYDMTFDFDTSVDVTSIEFVLINSPAGPSKTPQDFPINGATGVRSGSLDAKLDVTFTTPGTYEFGLDVLDANQVASNQLTGVITVQ